MTGVLCNAFAPGVDAEAREAVGVGNAAKAFALTSTLMALIALTAEAICPQLGLVPPSFLRLDVFNAEGAFGLGLSILAWRYFLVESIPR